MTNFRTLFWSILAALTSGTYKERAPMSTIPPVVRKLGLNADASEVRPMLVATCRAQAAYEAFAERLAVDAEFYSLRAVDSLLSYGDRACCQGLADTLWREHEAAKKSAEAFAGVSTLLRTESTRLVGEGG
jgi:hypothetical protein